MGRHLALFALAIAALVAVGCNGEPEGEHVSGDVINKQRESMISDEARSRIPKTPNGMNDQGKR